MAANRSRSGIFPMINFSRRSIIRQIMRPAEPVHPTGAADNQTDECFSHIRHIVPVAAAPDRERVYISVILPQIAFLSVSGLRENLPGPR